MTHVTCRLTAKNRDQLRNPTLGNRVWATFAFFSINISAAPRIYHELINSLALRPSSSCSHCPHSMRNRLYVTGGCPSVRPHVCPIDRQQHRRAAGLLDSIGRRAAGTGAQQQMRVASCREPTKKAQYRLVVLVFLFEISVSLKLTAYKYTPVPP